MSNRLITVFGATGGQGKTVALALQSSGFRVRALTRNPESSGAKDLLGKGVQVAAVDMNDSDSLKKVVSGSYGVFAVTNYGGLLSEGLSPEAAAERETKQGKAIGDVCKKEGVKHLVFSGLELVKDILHKPCLHFDSKGTVENYLDEIGVPNTSTRIAFYYENFIGFPPQKNDDGTYSVTFPMNGPMDAISVADLGPAVVTILNNPDKYIGKKLGLSGDRMSIAEYAAIISEVTGKTVKYNQVLGDVYSQFFPAAHDMAIMFEYYEVGKPVRDIELTRSLNPQTATFQEWAKRNKDKFFP